MDAKTGKLPRCGGRVFRQNEVTRKGRPDQTCHQRVGGDARNCFERFVKEQRPHAALPSFRFREKPDSFRVVVGSIQDVYA